MGDEVHRSNPILAAAHSTVELLERRTMLSVLLLPTGLTITGSAKDDVIYLYYDQRDSGQFNVKMNGKVSTFDDSKFAEVLVNPKGGNDFVQFLDDEGDLAKHVTINGDEGNDTLIGGAADDQINGDAGDDVIDGGGGNDTIHGSTGNDTIRGGQGHDHIYSEAGEDLVDGGVGDDRIYGGDGNDTLSGGAGLDTVHGGDGNDEIRGADGADILYGDTGNDWMNGGAGDDRVSGGLNQDILLGDDGNDWLDGGGGNDRLDGGAGEDDLLGGAGVNDLDGGEGNDDFVNTSRDRVTRNAKDRNGNDLLDEVHFEDSVLQITGTEKAEWGNVGLVDGSPGTIEVGINSHFMQISYRLLTRVNINLGDGKDLFDVDANIGGITELNGGPGNDELEGDAATVRGGSGNDFIAYGRRDQLIYDDDLPTDGGRDTILYCTGNDHIVLLGGDNFVRADEGDDVIVALGGNNTLGGGAGNDFISGGTGNDLITGEGGDDTLVGGGGKDTIRGNDGNDVLRGAGGNDALSGGPGDDDLDGGPGSDRIYGNDGNDDHFAPYDDPSEVLDFTSADDGPNANPYA